MKLTVLFLATFSVFAASPVAEIKVDQAGYLPKAPKMAIVVAQAPAAEFTVRRSGDGTVAFSGKLASAVKDADTGDSVQAADFTKLAAPGKYFLDVPGVGRSWEFSIGADAYSRAYYLAMRSYYGQRCGTAVDMGPEFPGYKYPACHLEGAYHASSGKTGPHVSTRGWHDAGDYGRYIVNSGITTGTLLWTYEMFGARVGKVKLNIPESGNATPDLLNEIRWNLDWMLTMQDADGGVWQKQTSDHFCGFVSPEKDTLVSYVIGTGKEPFKSSCATADFAAVMAIAGRIYKPFDAAYASKALAAAERAWKWLEKNPNVLYSNPKGVSTGAYGDGNCGDEALWAAAELWRTTRTEAYNTYFLAHYKEFLKEINSGQPAEGWAQLAAFGMWTYALGGAKGEAVETIRKASIDAANGMVDRAAANPYRITMVAKDYIWGSNGVAANYAMQLVVANALKADPRYVNTALDNLHYLLGRNTFSLSFVTQLGQNPYRHPHHRPSGGDTNEEPWPGLLSGGPNKARQDAVLQKFPAGTPPARIFADVQDSYASNETAINWNAPLVFVLASLQAGK